MSNLTTELRARVYDDDHGFYIEVRPDSDGLGLCELAYNDGGKGDKDISFPLSWSHAEAVANAILKIKDQQGDVK